MTEEDKITCVRNGVAPHNPSDEEIKQSLYGPGRKRLTEAEQIKLLETILDGANHPWRIQTLDAVRKIPPGTVLSYGEVARRANSAYGLNIGPRNVAWLRKKIYLTIGHDTDIPIHRIAREGDTDSDYDHPVTREFNRRKRAAEIGATRIRD